MSDSLNPSPSAVTPYSGKSRPKVPPFARYKGTSAWRKDRRRVRAYARFLAEANQTKHPGTPSA